jgi:xylulokinase
MAKLLGIDVGTSGAKAVLIDESGRMLRQAHAEYGSSHPEPTWSEQDPEDWMAGVRSCLQEMGEPEPDAIGLTGQMHGSVFLGAGGEVLRPAILWNDQRTAAECEEIDRRAGPERVREITRNPPLTGFQAPKILWLRNHEPDRFARARKVLLPKDFLRFQMTGELATEVSDASGTGLLDVVRRTWSTPLLDALELAPGLLPECHESEVPSATTTGSKFGLREGIPVVGGGGDQAAGAVGTGAVVPGVVSLSLGTSGVAFTSLAEPRYDPAGRAHTFCHANRAWHAMGVMLSCGGALKWFRDTFAPGVAYGRLAEEAAGVPPGAEGLTFLPYLAGERSPHNDPEARASFVGATASHGRAHFARAVFEGASFGLRDCLDVLEGLGPMPAELRITGGGAKGAFWVQMLADLTGTPCVTLEADEGPAFGAALLAGVGIGLWPNVAEACRATVRSNRRFEPSGADYSKAYSRFRALYPTLRNFGANS